MFLELDWHFHVLLGFHEHQLLSQLWNVYPLVLSSGWLVAACCHCVSVDGPARPSTPLLFLLLTLSELALQVSTVQLFWLVL